MLKKLLLSLLSLSVTVAANSASSSLRIHPHGYADTRGEEPMAQVIGLARTAYQDSEDHWQFSFHLEGETTGRRDVSLDLDRAWYHWQENSTSLYLGRAHPFEIAQIPVSSWSLLGQTQPQNFGIQLGYGLDPKNPLPLPLLMGWSGAHLLQTLSPTFSFEISATPFFIPSMGSEVTLFKDAPARAGRFARRPPGTIEVNQQIYPVRYEIDRSRLFQDVILNPQVFVTLKTQSDSYQPTVENWLSVSRAPNPNPDFNANEYLLVRENEIDAFAKVQPKFNPRWLASNTIRIHMEPFTFFSSFLITSDDSWGYEVGAEISYFSFSLLDENAYRPSSKSLSSNESRYTERLLQAQLSVPYDDWTFFAGLKEHLKQRDFWIFAGIQTPLFRHATLQTGVDLFSGDEATYFGEWRTNNRVGMALTWDIGS